MIRPTDSEIRAAAADPNGRTNCVFCHEPLNGRRHKHTPTCSEFCYRGEYGWFLQIHATNPAVESGLGRGWLTL